MANFWIVAQQVAILFVLMGVGFVARRAKLVTEQSLQGLVNVLIILVTPALIIDVFERPFDASMLGGLGIAAICAVVIHVLLILLVKGVFRRGSHDQIAVLRNAVVFSNAGFMGVPLEQAILGDRGVFYGVVYIVTFNLFIWSWGLRMMQPEKMPNSAALRRTMYLNPGTIGLAVGFVLFFFSLNLPQVIRVPIHMLSDLNTPLAMIVIGFCLAGTDFAAVLRLRRAYLAAFLRLVACPIVVTFCLYPFRRWLDPTMMLAVVIPAAAPVAAMVTLFATRYGRDVGLSVALVSGTTLLSVLTLPAVIALAMNLLGM